MKRSITIYGTSTAGITLKVAFSDFKESSPMSWPDLKIRKSWSSATTKAEGCEAMIFVGSPAFKDSSDAAEWIRELTNEIVQILRTDNALFATFKALQGDSEIPE